MKIIVFSGYFLVFTGLIHSFAGIILGWSVLLEMHEEFWFATTIIDSRIQFDREAIVWFLNVGFLWMLIGWMLQKSANQGFIPPESLGWGLFFMGFLTVIIMPISGAYLLIFQGAMLIYGTRKAQSNSKKATA
ncbi:DUF6463 family protein [Gilvimarinus sp. SDUM040013]|uniref:DUF6463 family protein n=1 Tax=Gilvimarinus gilvus TaxID=3058038 RepID=A0ABU4S2W9_9GAMM|nr:DUF6463 family protein [Gilvimarinus sp. SDUM040013]MDO3385655.1 DUF6463 family protein [Gilvimarinus sp. SDUM040013]MDX6851517.1 DUF6463 family protein [Gilvimarinus sp. SDUM040013]